MTELAVTHKKKLRKMAHHLKPVVMIGSKGVTDSLLGAVSKALLDHELIKIKFIDFKDQKNTILSTIISKTDANLVGIIGNIATLYKENSDKELSIQL